MTNLIEKIKCFYFYLRGLWILPTKNFIKAKGYFEHILDTTDNKYLTFVSNKYLGIIYCHENKFDIARDYLKTAKELFLEKNDIELICYLGLLADSEKKLFDAKLYYEKTIELYKGQYLIEINYIKDRLKKINDFFKK